MESKKFDGQSKTADGIEIWINVQRDSIIPEFDTIKEIQWEAPEPIKSDKYTQTVMKMASERMFLEDALKLRPVDVLNALEEEIEPLNIPKMPIIQALKAAIHDYFLKTDQKDRYKKATEIVICRCYNVTNHDFADAIKKGYTDFEALQKFTGGGTGCGSCRNQVKEIAENANKEQE